MHSLQINKGLYLTFFFCLYHSVGKMRDIDERARGKTSAVRMFSSMHLFCLTGVQGFKGGSRAALMRAWAADRRDGAYGVG